METKKNPAKELGNKRLIFLMIGVICSLSVAIGALSWSQPEVKPAKLTNPYDQIYKGDNELPPVTQPDKQRTGKPGQGRVVRDLQLTEDISIPIDIFPIQLTEDSLELKNPRQRPEDIPPVYLADEMPTFDGRDGKTAFSEWCQENLKYPLAAVENGAKGKVYISFIVEANGKLNKIEVVRSSGNKALDNAALEMVTKAPAKWKPAKNNGRPVRLMYVMPIEFVLE